MLVRMIAASLLAGLLAGCGSGGRPKPVPVIGKVMYKKDTPAAGAIVVFHPASLAIEKAIGGKPVATVKEDGTFALTMYADGDGAPEGEYGVTVDWRRKDKEAAFRIGEGGGGKSVLAPRFGDPRNPFQKVSVKKGEANSFAFEVD